MTDAELLAEIEAVKPKTSRKAATALGAAQGLSLGYGDELAGAAGAIARSADVPWDRTPGPRALGKLYPGMPYAEAASRWFNENRPDVAAAQGADEGRREAPSAYVESRNALRTVNDKAAEDRPGYFLGGEVVGGAVPYLLTGGAGPAAVAGLGAAQGAGFSRADTTRGLLGDSALGGAGGLAGYGVGKLVGKAVQGVGALASRRTAGAAQRAEELATKKVEKEIASLRGAYGGARQNESRAIEVLLRAEATGALTPQQAAQLATLKASPEWAATVQNVAQNYMDDFGGMASTATGAKTAYQQAAQNAPQALATEKARVLSGDMAKEQIKARLKRYGPMGVAGAIAGSTLGGPGGALLGGAAGAAVRPMIHAVRRAATHPAVQTRLWSPVQSAATAATSPTANVLRQSLARAGGTVTAPVGAEKLGNYLTKSKAERDAEAELARLLSD